jgi:methylthioribose-1-phosphate isomerase
VAKAALAEGKDPIQAIVENTVESMNRRYSTMQIVGDHLASLIPQGGTLLTQCYGETIIGTVIRAARKQNKDFKVFCAETRPYLQGARLTSSCFAQMGFDTTVITDNMVAYSMEQGLIDVFTSAADSIAQSGHIANKIGTFEKAVLAKEFGVPFYVAAPISTFDFNTATGEDIVIENRSEEEVTMVGDIRIAPVGSPALNPAFDMTPARYVTGFITEKGILRPDEIAKVKE